MRAATVVCCALAAVSAPALVGRARARAEICSAGGWCWERPLPQGNAIGGAWGTGPRALWLVGVGGTILRFDGQWHAAASSTDADLRAVWGSGPDDVWAVGDKGTILHFDGARWSEVPSGTRRRLQAVWCAPRPDAKSGLKLDAKSEAWIAGEHGTLLRWDGAQWSPVAGAGREDLSGVGGAGGVVWIAGHRGTLLRWDGAALTSVPVETTASLGRIIARAANDVTVIVDGGKRLHFDGTAWSRPEPSDFDLFAAWDGWALDRCGALYQADGKHPAPLVETGANLQLVSIARPPVGSGAPAAPFGLAPHCTPPPASLLNDVWLFPDGSGWAVGLGGELLRRGGAGWSPVSSPAASPAAKRADLTGLWASGPDDVWATSFAGLVHWDGKVWGAVGGDPLDAVWGNAANDVYAVGASGAVRKFDGRAWTGIATTTGLTLRGVWTAPGHVFAVGGDVGGARKKPGIALHRSGERWSELAVGQVLNAVWGSSPTDVWAVGDVGPLLHFDGKRWSPVDAGVTQELTAVAGTGPDDVWASGRGGALLHYDGHAWTPVASGTRNILDGLYAGPFGAAAVGTNGTILVRRAPHAPPGR